MMQKGVGLDVDHHKVRMARHCNMVYITHRTAGLARGCAKRAEILVTHKALRRMMHRSGI